MNKFVHPLKKHKEKLLIVALPIIMSLIAVVAIYIPTLIKKPTYDFIYSSCDGYCYPGENYKVDDGKVVITNDSSDDLDAAYALAGDNLRQNKPNDDAQLFYYDVSEGKSREIAFEETQIYQLDDSKTSPDGYRLGFSYGATDLFFGSYSNINVQSLINDGDEHITDIETYNADVLGWIINE